MPGKGITVSIEGLGRLEQNLKLLKKLPHTKDAKKVFFEAGKLVRNKARQLAPFDQKRKKGTHLRDAILVSPGPLLFSNVVVVVRYKRPGAPHAHLIEFGTARSAARPFMRPAASAMASQVEQAIHDGMIDLIKDTPQ